MTSNDEILFKKVESVILKHKLYLRHDMSRTLLDSYVHIPKNKFAPLFRACSGKSFPDYINSLRLDYAAKLLVDYPKYKIEGIARDCGIPVTQTFYRLFLAKFGVTPKEYRNRNCVTPSSHE
ncbi:MAG: AraC family transcriptional regulator [Prevotella sp.]|nr:AraC family transcriptional regulator [Prevotella sp.]